MQLQNLQPYTTPHAADSPAGGKSASAQVDYLPHVQVLRFFAALIVVFGHCQYEMVKRQGVVDVDAHLPRLLDWGLGVDVFFVISGFIMFYLTHDRFGRAGAPQAFLKRRMIRILPLYWLFTTLMLVSILVLGDRINNNGLSLPHVVASYLLFPWPRADGQLFPLLQLGWTLNYEMFFYVVFAAALFLPRAAGLALMAGLFALMTALWLAFPSIWWPLHFWGEPIVWEFVLGIGLAMAFLAGWRIGRPAGWAAIGLGLVLACIFFLTGSYEHVTRLVTGGLPAILIAGGTILVARPESASLPGWMRLLVLGGDASYALYLSHPFTINITSLLWSRLIGVPGLIFFTVTVLASIVLSIGVHFVLERPATRAIKRWLG